MKSQFFIPFFSLVMLLFAAMAVSETATPPNDSNSLSEVDAKLESILTHIGKASRELKTFQSGLSYLIIQDPDIVESRTLQTGNLYYQKENDRSKLRIRFEKLQQDDFEPEKYVEDYYFDGVWLTKVDYKLEQVSLYQQAPENEPVDVFELINDRFPLIGFSGTQTLQKDFIITLTDVSGSDPNEPIQLLLNVKEDSKYHESYKKIDFWIDKNTYSPVRVRAYSTQGDIYDVRFFDVKINKKLQNDVFTVESPPGFRENREALESTPEKKGP